MHSLPDPSPTSCPHNQTHSTPTHLQLLSPAHTPQSSNTPVGQQMPRGGSGDVQHVPCTSTATPLPLHTPQASKAPVQHLPCLSTLLPTGQHTPVSLSTSVVQQAPVTSTTPPGQGATSPAKGTSGTSQLAPPQPAAHTHWCAVVLHAHWTVGQSVAIWQVQLGARMVHGEEAKGRLALLQALAGTVAPAAVVHVTLRTRMPRPRPQAESVVKAGMHSLHVDTAHEAMVEGQGNTLHGRELAGAVW